MSHKNDKLESLLDKIVTITFTDGDVQTGLLKRNLLGYKPYYLRTECCDIIFAKSHVKSIKQE